MLLTANKRNIDAILRYRVEPDPDAPLPTEVGAEIEALWCDPVIPQLMERSTEFYLMDNAN